MQAARASSGARSRRACSTRAKPSSSATWTRARATSASAAATSSASPSAWPLNVRRVHSHSLSRASLLFSSYSSFLLLLLLLLFPLPLLFSTTNDNATRQPLLSSCFHVLLISESVGYITRVVSVRRIEQLTRKHKYSVLCAQPAPAVFLNLCSRVDCELSEFDGMTFGGGEEMMR